MGLQDVDRAAAAAARGGCGCGLRAGGVRLALLQPFQQELRRWEGPLRGPERQVQHRRSPAVRGCHRDRAGSDRGSGRLRRRSLGDGLGRLGGAARGGRGASEEETGQHEVGVASHGGSGALVRVGLSMLAGVRGGVCAKSGAALGSMQPQRGSGWVVSAAISRRHVRDQRCQLTPTPFVRLKVEVVQNAAALRYHTW